MLHPGEEKFSGKIFYSQTWITWYIVIFVVLYACDEIRWPKRKKLHFVFSMFGFWLVSSNYWRWRTNYLLRKMNRRARNFILLHYNEVLTMLVKLQVFTRIRQIELKRITIIALFFIFGLYLINDQRYNSKSLSMNWRASWGKRKEEKEDKKKFFFFVPAANVGYLLTLANWNDFSSKMAKDILSTSVEKKNKQHTINRCLRKPIPWAWYIGRMTRMWTIVRIFVNS